MRIYTEMECDCGCEDGKFCIYFNKDTKSCDFHKMRKVKIVKNKDRQQNPFFGFRGDFMNNEDKINKIIELLQSPDLDDYECCIEIAKVVGIYNYEREDNRD